MGLPGFLKADMQALQESRFFLGTKYAGIGILAFVSIIFILFLLTLILRRYFTRHPLINKAHRILIYLLTMSGVALLLLAGVLGLLLPIIPGIPLLIAGLLLMRRYHKSKWIEKKIAQFKHKVRQYRRRQRQYSAKH